MSATRMPDGSLKSVTGERRQRHLPRPPAAEGSGRRAISTASRSARIVRRIHAENKEGLTYPAQRVSEQRVHQVARPVLPSGGRDDRAGRHGVHHRHVPRHHPGRELRRARHLPARARSSSTTSTRSFTRAASGGWSTTASSRIDPTRCGATGPCRACTTRPPAQLVRHLSHPNGWWRDTAQQLLVLKQDKSVVPALQTIVEDVAEPARAVPRAVDARRARRARAGAGAAADGGSRAADAHPGDSRQRDALQGRRPIVRRRLQAR